MSKTHPVIVVTGSSGAGTSTVRKALEAIFYRRKINPMVIEGDSFHRYDRETMQQKIDQASGAGLNFSHFSEQANQFEKLEHTFRRYGESGDGEKRYYLHNTAEAKLHAKRLGVELQAGQFTPWETMEPGTDLLFYEGLHGLGASPTGVTENRLQVSIC
jgi:phosphoribulokinase